MQSNRVLIRTIATALLRGDWQVEAMVGRHAPCRKVDRLENGLAKFLSHDHRQSHLRDLCITRFSRNGFTSACTPRFSISVSAIVMEEGFQVNYRKTRIMRAATRQRLAGLVVNQGLNIQRQDYDRLKAILTNCIRHGPESQNRDEHPNFRRYLQGKIAFVSMVNAKKAKKLLELFRAISW